MSTQPDHDAIENSGNEKPLPKNSQRVAAESQLARLPKQPLSEKFQHELQVHQIELEMQIEELQHTQNVLEASHDCYVNIYELAPVCYLTLNRNSMISKINLTGAAMLGMERKKLLNRSFFQFVSPEDIDKWKRHFNMLQNEAQQTCELMLLRNDGYRFETKLTSLIAKNSMRFQGIDGLSLPNDDPNNSLQLHITITDISEVKAAERLMREKSQLLDSIVENIPSMIFLKRASDLRFELFNRAGENLLGYSRHDLIGKGNYDFWPKEQGDWFTAEDRRALASEKNIEIPEEQIKTVSGETRYLHTWKVALRDVNGEPTHLLGISLDITERKKAEEEIYHLSERKKLDEALLSSEANMRAMLDSSPYMAWLKDLEGRYIMVNQVYANYLKFESPEQAIGKIDMDLHSYELAEKYRSDDIEVMASRQQKHIEEAFSNGKDILWLETIKNPILDKEGNVLGTVGFACDITERKRIEQELIISNSFLVREVSKRTSDLSTLTAHIQEVAEGERSRIARELHDELGSTLTGLSMAVSRLKGKITDPILSQDLSEIKSLVLNASKTMRGVVDQLYPTILDHDGFSSAIMSLADGHRKRSEINVELILPKENIVMDQVHSLAAYRIAQECLTNIAKHAGASTISIEAKVFEECLNLIIHDNGKGLPCKLSGEGHGIFGMIERARYLGGSLTIGSEGENGTTVHLRLPLSSAKTKIKKRVLLVDDHAIVRNALRDLIASQTDDFSVEGEAADGNSAVQIALEGEWDIILCDITMPKKNGLEVLEEIKAVKPDLPIIMLSSHSAEEWGEFALSKGAACYIEKTDTDHLIEAMRRAMSLH